MVFLVLPRSGLRPVDRKNRTDFGPDRTAQPVCGLGLRTAVQTGVSYFQNSDVVCVARSFVLHHSTSHSSVSFSMLSHCRARQKFFCVI